MNIRSAFFAENANKQTDKRRVKHNLLGEDYLVPFS